MFTKIIPHKIQKKLFTIALLLFSPFCKELKRLIMPIK